MTLKEKLEVEIMDLPIMGEVVDDIAKNLEYIADDFAIGFADWILDGLTLSEIKELLEMYKKAEGL